MSAPKPKIKTLIVDDEPLARRNLRLLLKDVVYTDAPSFHIIDHAIYHTDLDTPALVPEAGLEAAVRAFAKIIDEVNTLDLTALRAPRASNQGR